MIKDDFEFATERLVLRFFRENDFQIWRDTFSTLPKPETEWDHGPRSMDKLNKEKFDLILSSQKKNRETECLYDFFAFHKDSGELIGISGLSNITRGVFMNAYLGYFIFHPKNKKKGYGKEMVEAIFQIAFKTLGLHRLEAGIEPENIASLKLADSLQMHDEGLSKKRLFLGGHWRDMRLFTKFSEDLNIDCKANGLTSHRY